jgi:hypothetical protein
MLEITAGDIAKLDDEQLRAVVARLCESELRQRGYSPVHVTWGGHQKASDGGIDVNVALPSNLPVSGFIPRADTGFQVKQEDTPARKIRKEMRPDGTVRPVIQALAATSGAYIMVSSKGSVAERALRSRRDAMREAVQDIANAGDLLVDFYDCRRIATWVGTHECLIPWVRALAGRSLRGWQSYGPWATPAEQASSSYLADPKARLYCASSSGVQGLGAVDGINALRDILRQPRRAVRLVGLSGVGKTRFVQALFDDLVGTASLNPSQAMYTNLGDSPDPPPVGMASDLATAKTPAVLIVDNCPSELHRRLSEISQQRDSQTSLLTIEYDIRDDTPEGTDVYRLEASSPDLIDHLLQRRFPSLSAVDRQTIAATDFCGGNARIAIALAGTVERQGTLAGLSDDDLFQRLFHQRFAHDASLLRTAQACSLVYSFQGEDLTSEESEVLSLGKLVAQSPEEVYRNIEELRARDLAQRRGVWRAVLPHAIANRLATSALRVIPRHLLAANIYSSARLWRSFSRRLGYLHNSAEAAAIAKEWLAEGGELADVAHLNDLGQALFHNVAPIAQEESLAAIERALRTADPEQINQLKAHRELLRSLAYESKFFERCTAAMATILSAEPEHSTQRDDDFFTSLFHLYLSGTHAPVELRAKVIEPLLASDDPSRQRIGLSSLSALLTSGHFMAGGSFEFGGQSRDFGYWPRSHAEVKHWFGTGLALAERIACGNSPASAGVRHALADHFRELWLQGTNIEDLDRLWRGIARAHFWPEGWRAIRQTLSIDGEAVHTGLHADTLHQLEQIVRPADIVQKVRAIVLTGQGGSMEVDDGPGQPANDIGAQIARVQARARELGEAVAADAEGLRALLPGLVSTNSLLLWFFGEGLANGTDSPDCVWRQMTAAFVSTTEAERRADVLRGFLSQLRANQPALVDTLLDEALEDAALGSWYPWLQTSVSLRTGDVARLKRSLELRRAPANRYSGLAYQPLSDQVAPQEISEMILTISDLPEGYDTALEILYMRLHQFQQAKEQPAPEIIATGQRLLQRFSYGHHDRQDHRLEDIAKACLRDGDGAVVAAQLCTRLKDAIAVHQTSAIYHDDLLAGIFTAQPVVALDAFMGGTEQERARGMRIVEYASGRRPLLGMVPDDILVAWCEQDAGVRYLALAEHIVAWRRTRDNAPPEWTRLAFKFLANAPDPPAVLRRFIRGFDPMGGFVGTRASAIEDNTLLLDQLGDLPALREAIITEKDALRGQIEEIRRQETLVEREFNERFE